MNNETIPFWQAIKALDEGKEVEWRIGDNDFCKDWHEFYIDILDCQRYSVLSKANYRIKEQKKRMAKALCKDNNGYFDSIFYYESLEHAKKMSPTLNIIKFPHGEWVEV